MKNVFATAQGFLGREVLNLELKTQTAVPPLPMQKNKHAFRLMGYSPHTDSIYFLNHELTSITIYHTGWINFSEDPLMAVQHLAILTGSHTIVNLRLQHPRYSS
jgi:hypothetical protein